MAFSKIDRMDLLLYAVMQDVPDRDEARYNAATPMTLSRAAWDRIRRNIERRIQYAEQHAYYNPALELCKRIVAAILLVMSIGFASIMGIEGVREAIWETVTTWYEEHIVVRFDAETKIEAPDNIVEYKEPVVGAEYERYEKHKSERIYLIEYKSIKYAISYEQRTVNKYKALLSNQGTDMNDIAINGRIGKMTTTETDNEKYYILIWHDDVYCYKLCANMELSELIAIAETVK